MGSNKEIEDYTKALSAAIRQQYPDIYISIFEDIGDDFQVPAIVINPPRFGIAENTVKTKLTTTFTLYISIYICYSATEENCNINCLQTSIDLAAFIEKNTFGQRTPAKVTDSEPTLIEGLENFIIQRIDYQQNLVMTNI